MKMSLQAALSFRMPNGKRLADMTDTDWRLEDKRVAAEMKTLAKVEARGHLGRECVDACSR